MSRRGYSLSELLIVTSMTGVVFSVAVGMVHRVLHEQKFAGRDNTMHRVAERLSTTLREDIHRATTAELIQPDGVDEQTLNLRMSGQRIVTYTLGQFEVKRISNVEGEPTHRDRFQFPDNYRLEFSEDAGERIVFTAFAIPYAYLHPTREESRRDVTESDVRRAVMLVAASVARDHRFDMQQKAGER